jgi:hypothetical protein
METKQPGLTPEQQAAIDGIYSRPQSVGVQSGKVEPPIGAYVRPDEGIQFTAWDNGPGTAVTITARFLRAADGQVVYMTSTQRVQSGLNKVSWWVPLTEGYLLDIQASLQSAAYQRGLFFLQGALQRQGGTIQPGRVLFQGYLSANCMLSWPGSAIINSYEGPGAWTVYFGTAPGVGVAIVDVVPQYHRWNIVSGMATLTTSATVANRLVYLQFEPDGANITYTISTGIQQTASTTWKYVFTNAVAVVTQSNTTTILIPIPAPLVLPYGANITLGAGSLQAGDQFTAAAYQVEDLVLTN